jgi:hypothetical protein
VPGRTRAQAPFVHARSSPIKAAAWRNKRKASRKEFPLI